MKKDVHMSTENVNLEVYLFHTYNKTERTITTIFAAKMDPPFISGITHVPIIYFQANLTHFTDIYVKYIKKDHIHQS